MEFASDNTAGASPHVLQALVAANRDAEAAYGEDRHTRAAQERLATLFECECSVFLVATGTAANALALASLSTPWAAVFCHAAAHVLDSECGAPEMFSGGAKIVGVPGAAGKLTPAGLSAVLAAFPAGPIHQVQPAALSLSQATECGTLYSCDEIGDLASVAHAAGLGVHMDGARFANALVGLGCTPAQMSWKAGVDVLSFGATKNGALACEAVVLFGAARDAAFAFRRKRSGHTVSKGRFLGAQMAAYLEEDRWLATARHANHCAATLAAALAAIPGVRIHWPAQANEVFAVLPERVDAALKTAGAHYYPWNSAPGEPALAAGEVLVRLVCSFATDADEVDRFVAVARGAA